MKQAYPVIIPKTKIFLLRQSPILKRERRANLWQRQ